MTEEQKPFFENGVWWTWENYAGPVFSREAVLVIEQQTCGCTARTLYPLDIAFCPLHARAQELVEALRAFRDECSAILTETGEEWPACHYCNHAYPQGEDKHGEDCPWGTAQALLRDIDGETG